MIRRVKHWGLRILIPLCFAAPLYAADTQALFEEYVVPDLKAVWLVADDFPKREEEAKNILKKVSFQARELLDRLDPLNPLSEMASLSAKQVEGEFAVSPDLAKILSTTQEIAKQLNEPLAKRIKVDLQKNRVRLKKTDVTINIEPLLKGYLADAIMKELLNANFPNSLLELGGVFVTRGQDFNGPWKIEVSDQTTENAHHTFLYKAFDTAAATIADDQRDFTLPVSDIRSVTIFSKEGACKAQGLASAVYALGLAPAQKFLKESQIERAVLLDTEGRFYQFPESEGKKQ